MFRSYLPVKVDKRAIEEQRKKEEEDADLKYFGLATSPESRGSGVGGTGTAEPPTAPGPMTTPPPTTTTAVLTTTQTTRPGTESRHTKSTK
jgi:hypothetical protein